MKKIMMCLLLCMSMAMFAGCGANDSVSDSVTATCDDGSAVVTMDTGGEYTVKSDDAGFTVTSSTGDKIEGIVVSSAVADEFESTAFSSAEYNVISVNGCQGFACASGGKYIHFVAVPDSSVFVKLTADADSMIYGAEEHMTIEKA